MEPAALLDAARQAAPAHLQRPEAGLSVRHAAAATRPGYSVLEVGIAGAFSAAIEVVVAPEGSAGWLPRRVVVGPHEDGAACPAYLPHPRTHLFRALSAHAGSLLVHLDALPPPERTSCDLPAARPALAALALTPPR
uniref:Uncharacterized protein n=2 Tax=Emiliania huxleyi TaxID=2903 RepID=A0A0D3J758_EMIH1